MTEKPIVLVQTNHIERLTRPLAQAARDRGYAIADYSMMDGREMELPDISCEDSNYYPVFIYGSLSFCRHWDTLRATKRWLFRNERYLSVLHWKSMFRTDFLNCTGSRGTVGEYLGTTALPPCHIRPIAATAKELAGGVFSRDELAALDLPPNTDIWVSEPQDIKAEVRIWVVHEQFVAASMYRADGAHLRTTDHPLIEPAVAFAQRAVNGFHVMPHYVIDVALTDHGWKVVEMNPINSSGWYAADPGIILDAYVNGYSAP